MFTVLPVNLNSLVTQFFSAYTSLNKKKCKDIKVHEYTYRFNTKNYIMHLTKVKDLLISCLELNFTAVS